jgi:hypothetical protein
MEAEYVRSLVSTIQHLSKNNISYMFLNQYSSQVSAAREATIMGSRYLDAWSTQPLSGKYTYDKIIWIDSDISWDVDQFISIYESEHDIISGVYFNEEGIPMYAINERIPDYRYTDKAQAGNTFEVFGVGFGFVAVKSGVFESIARPWFEIKFEKITNDDREMFVPWGEDFSWCIKAHESGYKIHVDPMIKVKHHKKIQLG